MRKVTKKTAEKRALKAMSDYIRERDNWTCFTSGICYKDDPKRAYKVDTGHFISRRYAFIKFDERNVHAQSVADNRYKSGNWDVYYERMLQEYGQDVIDELMSKRHVLIKRSVQDYLDIEAYYKKKLSQIIGGK